MLNSRKSALASTVNAIKKDIETICQSGNYYVTDEIGNELNVLSNGLDHLKLDGYLLSSSPDWRQGMDPAQSQSYAQSATSGLDNVAATLYDYKNKMGNEAISKRQENEIRELHHWAVLNLKKLQNEMAPFTHGAADRIKQFGDHVGVTDRFTGYRNNLTRGTRDPFELQTGWMDKSVQGGKLLKSTNRSISFADETRPTRLSQSASPTGVRFGGTQTARVDTKGYQTIDTLFPRSKTMFADSTSSASPQLAALKAANQMNATPPDGVRTMQSASGPRTLSVQEQAGINTTFPGKTEYMTRYKTSLSGLRASAFTINPIPDLSLHGRPLGLTTCSPSYTEYHTRYEWPDGNQIVKLPWRRK